MTSDIHFDKEDPSSILRVPLQSKTKDGKVAFLDKLNYNKKLYFSYIRMSTGKQTQENSPKMQRDFLKSYTKSLGIDYEKQVIEFADPWESGFKVKVINGKAVWTPRREFARMWENIKACKVPCEVFVYDISRYSRHDQIGVQELSIALWVEWKEHQRIEKFHIAETEEIYTLDTPGSKISGDIRSKMQESEGKRRKSNGNIKIWTEKKILPKMVSGTLSSNKVFEWVSENGVDWVRKWINFFHIENAMDMRIDGRTTQEILEYLSSHNIHYGKWLNVSIFTNQVFIGIYCPKKWKDKGEVFELEFLDCTTPISREKWDKLQKTMKHRVPYMTRQIDWGFLKPIIHIMRYMWGDISGKHFRFYSKIKWEEQYWYIRYRKGNKTLVTISLIEVLKQFIKQQWEALFDIFYNISKKAFQEYYKDKSFFIDGFISKKSFKRKDDIETSIIKELDNLVYNTRFAEHWTDEKLTTITFTDTIKEVFAYRDYLLKDISQGNITDELTKEYNQIKEIITLYLVWHWAQFGEDILQKLFLKNISTDDKKLIESSKVQIEILQNEIRKKEIAIEEINDRIIEGVITKELLPRANEKKEVISQEITQIQKRIAGLEHSSDIEKYIAQLPEIIRKIGELTKKPFTEKDFNKEFPQIVKLLEITCGELTLTKEKALKIGLYEVLERMKDIDNLNWQSSWESNSDQRLWRPLY